MMAYSWVVDGAANRTTGTYTAADTTTTLNWSFWTTNPLPGAGVTRQLVVLAPGGGWVTADQTSDDGMGRHFVEKGYQSVALSYRVGASNPYPAAANDIPLGIAAVIAANDADPLWIDKTLRYIAFGSSAGGTVMLEAMIASPTSYACGAFWSPPTDFVTLDAQATEQGTPNHSQITTAITNYCSDNSTLKAAASPALHIPGNLPPIRITFETAETIPVKQQDELYAACGVASIPCTSRRIVGSNHGILIINDTDPIDGIAEYLATTNWCVANSTGPTTPFTTIRGFGHL